MRLVVYLTLHVVSLLICWIWNLPFVEYSTCRMWLLTLNCVLIFFLSLLAGLMFSISCWWLLSWSLAKILSSAFCCILWTKDVLKKTPQDTYLFLEFQFICHSKGEGPVDVPRQHISKVGAVLILQGHSGCHVIYLLLRKGQSCQLTCQLSFISVGIHRLCNRSTAYSS